MCIQHVSIPRPPGEKSRLAAKTFFSGVLGLAEKPVPRSVAHLDLIWFQAGELEIHCFSEAPIEDPSGRHFCLVVDDAAALTAMRTTLLDAGYAPWNPEAIPGRPRFFCRDPFNNIIEFTTIIGDYQQLELGSYRDERSYIDNGAMGRHSF